MSLLGERVAPVCPVCDGPCQHPFPRSPHSFPDRLPKAPMHRASRDPEPEKPKRKPKLRGRRKDRDRMIHGPERTTAIAGPLEDRTR